MISIGIRVTPKKVFFAIAELENEEIRTQKSLLKISI